MAAPDPNIIRREAYLLNADEAQVVKFLELEVGESVAEAAVLRNDAAIEQLIKGDVSKARSLGRQAVSILASAAEPIGKALAVTDIAGRQELYLRSRGKAATPRTPAPPGTPPLPPSRGDDDLPAYLKLPFREAVAAMRERVPEMVFDASEVEAVYRRGGFAVAKAVDLETVKKAQQLVVRAVETGADADEMYRLGRSAGWTDGYSETVFRTNVKTATGAGRQMLAMSDELEGFLAAWRYVAVGDTDTRSNHNAMDGFMASVRNPVWRVWLPPNGFNCLLPGTRVAGAFVAASRARYSGQAVKLRTADGVTLAVTANHPVLTGRGWIAAQHVRDGDYLLRHAGGVQGLDGAAEDPVPPPLVAGRAVHNQKMPALVENVFDTFAAGGVASLSRSSPLDFHGDARAFQSDVDVVLAYGHFPNDSDTGGLQGGNDVGLAFPVPPARLSVASGGVRDAVLRRADRSSRRVPSPTALLRDTFGGVGSGFDRRPLQPFRVGATARLNLMLDKHPTDDGARDAERFGQRLLALSREIRPDKCIGVEMFDFTGHVFDLQTPTGWLFANGLVASNCRCAVAEITIDDARDMGRLDAAGRFKDDPLRDVMPDPGFDHSPAAQAGYPGR